MRPSPVQPGGLKKRNPTRQVSVKTNPKKPTFWPSFTPRLASSWTLYLELLFFTLALSWRRNFRKFLMKTSLKSCLRTRHAKIGTSVFLSTTNKQGTWRKKSRRLKIDFTTSKIHSSCATKLQELHSKLIVTLWLLIKQLLQTQWLVCTRLKKSTRACRNANSFCSGVFGIYHIAIRNSVKVYNFCNQYRQKICRSVW